MLDTNNLSFREDLKLARKAAGFSGAALSKAIGISAGMVSRYESHNRNDGVLPGADTLKKSMKCFSLLPQPLKNPPPNQQHTSQRANRKLQTASPCRL